MANELMDAYHAGRMDAFAKVLSQRQYLRLDQAGTDWLKAQFDKELAAKQADAAL